LANSHTNPLTHLAHLLHRHQLTTITFFTTTSNALFIWVTLSGSDGVAIVELPFMKPEAAECGEDLPSLSAFRVFLEAVSTLHPTFEEVLTAVRPPPAWSWLTHSCTG
jgi:hypothetical protein